MGKNLLFYFSLLFVSIVLSSCDNSNEKAKLAVENLIKSAQSGDSDCLRKYCRGELRDIDIIARLKFVALMESMARYAEESGENTYTDFMDNAMEKYYSTDNKLVQSFAKIRICGEISDYPLHGDVCKMINVQFSEVDSVSTFFIHKIDDKWFVVSSMTIKDKSIVEFNEELYTNKIMPKEKFDDPRFYDVESPLSWQVMDSYINN